MPRRGSRAAQARAQRQSRQQRHQQRCAKRNESRNQSKLRRIELKADRELQRLYTKAARGEITPEQLDRRRAEIKTAEFKERDEVARNSRSA